MARIGFCGLGLMGTPMVKRLIHDGHGLAVWNRTAEKAEPLREAGAEVAATPANAARGRDIVITMVADGPALEEVLFGEDGVAAGIGAGAILVEMSTVGRDAALDAAERLPAGVEMLDAPVMGSTPRAEAGGLQILVGGSDEAFERARAVLEVLGTPRHVGERGAGAAMKLVMNSTLGALVMALGESISLGTALGIDRTVVLDALEDSYLGPLVKLKREMIESGEYPTQFRLSLAAKDLRLVEEAAADAGLELRGITLARQMFDEAAAAGRSDQDYAALVANLQR